MSRSRRHRTRSTDPASPKRPVTTGRFMFLLGVLILGLLAVSAQLVRIQVIEGPRYAARAADQRTRDIVLAPERGFILDREGEVLAETVPARTVSAMPASIEDKPGVARAIAGALGGDEDDYLQRLERDSNYVYVARKVDPARAAALEALDITGLSFHDDSRRVYPSNELGCQVLGFVGVDDQGLSGLELSTRTGSEMRTRQRTATARSSIPTSRVPP